MESIIRKEEMALFFQGYNDRKEYISTQGPLASTSDDFWRMVWEQNSRAIVNLTRCHEKGRVRKDGERPDDLSDRVTSGQMRPILAKRSGTAEVWGHTGSPGTRD